MGLKMPFKEAKERGESKWRTSCKKKDEKRLEHELLLA
jgi:hypothetical protein